MEMRKHASWYFKGLKGNGRVRNRINAAETREEMLGILYEFAADIEEKMKVS
ncbi:hypothetical protein [Halobacillus sp. Marseille-Q1614]|uniref:hypothetical protein n=1 Tax=Halobacillus sp. Marseille-Q1614 TaxID=2709134 RepID=UPI0015710A05|nr:hypothetical protein [Halobacillus sp. Marseille-Q1614]